MLLYDDGLRQQCDDAVVDDEVLANMLSLSLLFSSVDANADNFSACHCVYLRYGNCVLRCGVLFLVSYVVDHGPGLLSTTWYMQIMEVDDSRRFFV